MRTVRGPFHTSRPNNPPDTPDAIAASGGT